MFKYLLSYWAGYEIAVKEIGFGSGVLPITVDNIATSQFTSIAPELFLILCVTIIWCYLAVKWEPRAGIIALRYVFIITMLLYLCSIL